MKRAMKAAAFAQGNVSSEREQSRTCSGFVEREKYLTKLNDYFGEFHTVGNSVQSDGL
ncbi:MAG: hypothetical protein AB2L24_18715 [Mangrovibacterium sp.]